MHSAAHCEHSHHHAAGADNDHGDGHTTSTDQHHGNTDQHTIVHSYIDTYPYPYNRAPNNDTASGNYGATTFADPDTYYANDTTAWTGDPWP